MTTSESRTLPDGSQCHVAFNVMPERGVTETLRMREFRIGETWIEAEFERTYLTEMLSSPSHLTFVSALVQMQKITYVYCCHRFGFPLDLTSEEALKIWPTDIHVRMRNLVSEEAALVHRLDITGFRRMDTHKYFASTSSTVNGTLQIDASALIHLLRDPC